MGGKLTGRRARCSIIAVAALTPFFAHRSHTLPTHPRKSVGADVSWLLTSSALVLMMTIPGLALFYGGMVRRKNVLIDLDAELHPRRRHLDRMGAVRLQPRFRARQLAHRRTSMARAIGVSASEPFAGYSADGAASGLHDLSMHVRDHHARADHRRHRRADVVPRLSDVQPCCGRFSSTIRSRIGYGASTDGSISSARSISRAAPSFTFRRALRRWPPCSLLGKRHGISARAYAAA